MLTFHWPDLFMGIFATPLEYVI